VRSAAAGPPGIVATGGDLVQVGSTNTSGASSNQWPAGAAVQLRPASASGRFSSV
jgi:hypothetical protein